MGEKIHFKDGAGREHLLAEWGFGDQPDAIGLMRGVVVRSADLATEFHEARERAIPAVTATEADQAARRGDAALAKLFAERRAAKLRELAYATLTTLGKIERALADEADTIPGRIAQLANVGSLSANDVPLTRWLLESLNSKPPAEQGRMLVEIEGGDHAWTAAALLRVPAELAPPYLDAGRRDRILQAVARKKDPSGMAEVEATRRAHDLARQSWTAITRHILGTEGLAISRDDQRAALGSPETVARLESPPELSDVHTSESLTAAVRAARIGPKVAGAAPLTARKGG
ncbi:MAG: hypothetical protein IT481_01375 [Gammaproteobacteria bacterium]|nr:hypothetical protein [Gammaproteobacteria bacterium]